MGYRAFASLRRFAMLATLAATAVTVSLLTAALANDDSNDFNNSLLRSRPVVVARTP